ncbi:MAG: hypothetical protein ACLFSM_09260 [Thermoplasmata archaeon]
MNVNKIIAEDDESKHVIIAMTLSEAADATEELEERCDEIRDIMKSLKIYEK